MHLHAGIHKSTKPIVPLSPYATISVLDMNYTFAAYIYKHNRSKYAHKRFQWMPFACSNSIQSSWKHVQVTFYFNSDLDVSDIHNVISVYWSVCIYVQKLACHFKFNTLLFTAAHLRKEKDSLFYVYIISEYIYIYE